MAEASSRLLDFLKFLSSIRGDLAGISAPPFLLAPFSVVEVAGAWLQRPSLFAACARETTPERRALMVLKWILASHKPQFYLGGSPSSGLKKPLNAFLGEVFLARYSEGDVDLHLASEQVSHHPPVTAVYIWDDVTGIRADGYVRVEMTFSGSVDVRQTGHVVVHVDEYDEDYLIPFPTAKVKGFLSGQLYPELSGTYRIISSSGYVAEITYSGQGLFMGGKRNSFDARVYHRDDESRTSLYTAKGQWIGEFSITDAQTGVILERYSCLEGGGVVEATVTDLENQDPWESRKAWARTLSALKEKDFKQTTAEKSKVEKAQRAMRAREAEDGISWQPLLFRQLQGGYNVFQNLTTGMGWNLHPERTKGVWKPDIKKIKNLRRPFRGNTTPLG